MNASELLNILADHRRSQRDFLDWSRSVGRDHQPFPRLKTCGSWLLFREWLDHGGETTLRNANFCKAHLLCPACAVRRASKLIEAYLPKLECAIAENAELKPIIVTLAFRNTFDLAEGMKTLKGAWSRMVTARRRDLSKAGKGSIVPVEWCKVLGGVRAFEVTNRNEGKGWHPHMHAFVVTNEWLDRDKLLEEWQRFGGVDYEPTCHVTRCKNGIRAGLVEVLKYVCKLSDLSHAQRWEAWRDLAGSRLSDPFGVMRGIPEPNIDVDDDSALSGAWREFVAVWRHATASYELRFEEKGERLSIERGVPADVGPRKFTDTGKLRVGNDSSDEG